SAAGRQAAATPRTHGAASRPSCLPTPRAFAPTTSSSTTEPSRTCAGKSRSSTTVGRNRLSPMPPKKLKPPPPISPRDGDALLLVGTMKGLFLLHADRGRRRFRVSGPHFPGQSVYAAAFDSRAGRHRIWAAPSSMHWGAELAWSDD